MAYQFASIKIQDSTAPGFHDFSDIEAKRTDVLCISNSFLKSYLYQVCVKALFCKRLPIKILYLDVPTKTSGSNWISNMSELAFTSWRQIQSFLFLLFMVVLYCCHLFKKKDMTSLSIPLLNYSS